METFESTLKLVTKGMYLCIKLISDTHTTQLLLQKSIEFFYASIEETKLKQFSVLHSDLAHGPLIFTKLLKPVYATLRNKGHISSGFIGDPFLGSQTVNECELNVGDTVDLMKSLGFMINKEKSSKIPYTRIGLLGFTIDSVLMIVLLTDEMKTALVEHCSKLCSQTEATIRKVAQVIGFLVAAFSAVDYGKLHYRKFGNC